MGNIISDIISLILIGTVATGIAYAMKLIKQLQELRGSRAEMERFVAEFSGTVQRAETGVRNLRQAAREGGDDLEKLIEKAQLIRDELHFLIESADTMASRISKEASGVARQIINEPVAAAPSPTTTMPPAYKPAVEAPANAPQPATKAERDLMQALGQLGGAKS
jgi:cell division septum initiation protein DivIVA